MTPAVKQRLGLVGLAVAVSLAGGLVLSCAHAPKGAPLTPEQRERIRGATNLNNSDIDFCEYQGRLVITYSWGNQQGIEHLKAVIGD